MAVHKKKSLVICKRPRNAMLNNIFQAEHTPVTFFFSPSLYFCDTRLAADVSPGAVGV